MSIVTVPGTGAKAREVSGTYIDNLKNRKLGRVGQSYTRYVFVADPDRKGKPIMVTGKDGRVLPISRLRKPVNETQATRAFNAYWNARVRAAPDQAHRAGVLRAKGKDVAYSYKNPKRTVTNSRYNKHSAGRLDYPGVDAGPKRFKGPSAATLAKLRAAAAANLAAAVAAGKKHYRLSNPAAGVEEMTGMPYVGQQGGRRHW
jgi:hypothetical protein